MIGIDPTAAHSGSVRASPDEGRLHSAIPNVRLQDTDRSRRGFWSRCCGRRLNADWPVLRGALAVAAQAGDVASWSESGSADAHLFIGRGRSRPAIQWVGRDR